MTPVLVLFILYLGLIALWRAIDDPGRAAKAAAILTLVGAVDLPIIKFSVDWWNTLHQPASVFRLDGPTIAPELLMPLLVMSLAFTCLFLTLHLMAIRNEILRRRIARVTMLAAAEGDRLPPGNAARGAGAARKASSDWIDRIQRRATRLPRGCHACWTADNFQSPGAPPRGLVYVHT